MRYAILSRLYLRCARYLIYHYPASWRERYAEEMFQLLEDDPPTFRTVINLFFHLFDAYTHPQLLARKDPALLHSLRSSELAIYSSAVIFLFASTVAFSDLYFGFMDRYIELGRLASLIPLLNVDHYSSPLFILFIMLGGLPICLATVRNALMARKYQVLLFFLLSLICPTIITVFLAPSFSTTIGNPWWNVFSFFLIVATSLTFIHMAVRNVAPSRRITQAVFYLAAPLPLIMLAVCISLPFSILPAVMSSDIFSFNMSNFWLSGYNFIWNSFSFICVMFLIMVATCSFSFFSLFKGFRAERIVQDTL